MAASLGTTALIGTLRPGWAAEDGLQFGEPRPFDFQALAKRARAMAGQEYQPPPTPAPDVVSQIDYETHGKLTYRRRYALFAEGGGAFPITFFHLGRYFPTPVRMHVVKSGEAREIIYSPDYFEMPPDSIARQVPAASGFAGFRVHESRERDDWRTQDWAAFLGASYFRAIGALGQYGMSARGVAIDTATGRREEFPNFVEIYIEESGSARDPVMVYALLDGPGIVGAYSFALERSRGVIMDVDARLFPRHDISLLGVAPLTSMFWYAEHNRPYRMDWRPEVHDSDGLALWTGTHERIWRPLNNPDVTRGSSFHDLDPRGFGLMQRDRNFEHYLDGVHYERRPSLWVEPLGNWGEGTVRLVEIPTDDEIHDNIVAFWVPAEPARKGTAFSFRYRLHWLADHPYPAHHLAQTFATRTGRGGEAGKPRPEGVVKFVIEFSGAPLDTLGPYDEPEAVVTSSRGNISLVVVERVPDTPRWQARFDLQAEGKEPVELRLYLRLGERALTETWTYQHLPTIAYRTDR